MSAVTESWSSCKHDIFPFSTCRQIEMGGCTGNFLKKAPTYASFIRRSIVDDKTTA